MKFPYDTNYYPPAPTIEIQFGAPGESLTIGPLIAFVDTGADVSIIPTRYISPLGLTVSDRKRLRSQWGEPRQVNTYFLEVGIGDLRLPMIEVVADERGSEIIVGRNILNGLNITLNGPRRVVDVRG
jgi:predicted aspartyl protease